ncbi:RHS repeat-associated core domain-containing protein, partial [archaeon]|nr:RHS repeat-associated core domain-containing protein [archaeon]
SFATGKELDESNLYYFGARYYDSESGRFTSVDPVKENHAYSYVNNNPVNYIDVDGRNATKCNSIIFGTSIPEVSLNFEDPLFRPEPKNSIMEIAKKIIKFSYEIDKSSKIKGSTFEKEIDNKMNNIEKEFSDLHNKFGTMGLVGASIAGVVGHNILSDGINIEKSLETVKLEFKADTENFNLKINSENLMLNMNNKGIIFDLVSRKDNERFSWTYDNQFEIDLTKTFNLNNNLESSLYHNPTKSETGLDITFNF